VDKIKLTTYSDLSLAIPHTLQDGTIEHGLPIQECSAPLADFPLDAYPEQLSRVWNQVQRLAQWACRSWDAYQLDAQDVTQDAMLAAIEASRVEKGTPEALTKKGEPRNLPRTWGHLTRYATRAAVQSVQQTMLNRMKRKSEQRTGEEAGRIIAEQVGEEWARSMSNAANAEVVEAILDSCTTRQRKLAIGIRAGLNVREAAKGAGCGKDAAYADLAKMANTYRNAAAIG